MYGRSLFGIRCKDIPVILYCISYRKMSFFKRGGKSKEDGAEEGSEAEKPKKSNKVNKEPSWKQFSGLPQEKRRRLYKCGSEFVTLANIPTWSEYRKKYLYSFLKKEGNMAKSDEYAINPKLNEKVSIWRGDITTLEIDAIVNAANSSLLGGGGVDGCIHRAAGRTLSDECVTLHGCETGDAKITSGHKLPAKYIIHTVGPFGENRRKLTGCYRRCMKVAKENGVRSIAFCCIATGIYGYPNYEAAEVALSTIRNWLEKDDNADYIDRIIFCLFLPNDEEIYEFLLPRFFPCDDHIIHSKGNCEGEDKEESTAEPDQDDVDIKKGIPKVPKLEDLLDSCEGEEPMETNEPRVDKESKDVPNSRVDTSSPASSASLPCPPSPSSPSRSAHPPNHASPPSSERLPRPSNHESHLIPSSPGSSASLPCPSSPSRSAHPPKPASPPSTESLASPSNPESHLIPPNPASSASFANPRSPPSTNDEANGGKGNSDPNSEQDAKYGTAV